MTLPRGWVWTTLGDICFPPQYGWTTSASIEGNVRLLRTTDITPGKIDWESVPYCAEEPAEKEKYLLHDGDIVISRAGSVGYSHLVKNPRPAIFASYLIRFKPLIDEHYLAYFLQSPSYWDSISEKSLGIAIPNVNASKLKQIALPLASLPEQHRIVAEIEKQFTRLDAGVAALRRAQANLKHYKASVLKAACEGRLVPQDPNDEPASALLKRILAERRRKWEADLRAKGKDPSKAKYIEPQPSDTDGLPELPEGWCWAAFEQVISEFRSGTTAVPHDGVTGFPILRSSSVRPRQIDYADVRYLAKENSRDVANFLQVGNLLFTRLSGSLDYVGNCALVRNPEVVKIQYPDRIFCATLVDEGLGEFVEAWFSTPLARKQTMAMAKSTAGHQRISMDAIKRRHVSLPPIAEQRRIVAEVERRLSVVQEVEGVIAANLARAERLRQSILKQAFEGKLVAQDPNDEPASVLLERIKAQRVGASLAVAQKPARRSRSKSRA